MRLRLTTLLAAVALAGLAAGTYGEPRYVARMPLCVRQIE